MPKSTFWKQKSCSSCFSFLLLLFCINICYLLFLLKHYAYLSIRPLLMVLEASALLRTSDCVKLIWDYSMVNYMDYDVTINNLIFCLS